MDCIQLAEYPSQAWHDRHAEGISGHDAVALLGESKYSSPLKVWAHKTGLEAPPALDGEHLYWGQRLEDVLADEYETRAGRKVVRNAHLLRARAEGLSYVIGTPDGFVYSDEHTGPGVWEAKTTRIAADWDNGVPEWVCIQVHHYMILTGCTWGSVCCLINGQKYVWADIPLDARLAERLAQREHAFWHGNVLAEQAPEPSDLEDDRRVLGLMRATENGKPPLPLEGNGLVVAQRYVNLGVSIKELETERRRCGNALRKKLQAKGAHKAEGGGYSVNWTSNNQLRVRSSRDAIPAASNDKGNDGL